MCHSLGTPLAKANHLWFSAYTEMARGALAEDLRPHSLNTNFKRSAVPPVSTANTAITENVITKLELWPQPNIPVGHWHS